MNKIQKFLEDKAATLQETGKDIAWSTGKLYEKTKEKAKKAASELGIREDLESGSQRQRKREKQEKPEHVPVPDSWEEQEQKTQEALTETLDQAVFRAYYKEGGFRYFGCCLLRYVEVVLPSETELGSVWAAGYNSSISPMLRQLKKLEEEMERLRQASGQEPLPLKNEELLQKMRDFKRRALHARLDFETGWELEDYRQVLQQYAKELNERLLEPYQSPQGD